jgi:hypothetical protein
MGQKVCCGDCAISLAVSERGKAEKVAKVKERKDDAVKRDKLKTRSDWIKECQTVINRYVRLRDIRDGHGCISCGAPYRGAYGGAFDAGHYRSTGAAVQLRFYLPNIRLQCVKCNRHLGGNAIEFRRGLVARIGQDAVERIESMQGEPKWSVEYLKRLKTVFARKANRMEKRINA